jgi:DNA polymerase elongation subunit (family B)
MNEKNYHEFLNDIRSGAISPYQLYNADIDYPQYFATQHYLNNPNDNIDMHMPLSVCLLDIEVYTANAGEFPAPQIAKFPLSAITLRNTTEKRYVSFIKLIGRNINNFPKDTTETIEYYKQELIKNEYIDEDEDIAINVFDNELQMFYAVWSYIHNSDPVVLSGWSSSEFDIPYMYQRACGLTGDEKGEKAAQIMSKFGIVKKSKLRNNILINISDYTDMDLLYLYKPRSDGGLVN